MEGLAFEAPKLTQDEMTLYLQVCHETLAWLFLSPQNFTSELYGNNVPSFNITLLPPQRSCRKVMFSRVSVFHSVEGGSHVTITHDA